MSPALLLLTSSWIAGAQQLPPIPPAPPASGPVAGAPVGGPAPAYVSSGHGCSGPNCGPVAHAHGCGGCDPCGSSRKGLLTRIGGGGLFSRFRKADCGCDPCGHGHGHGVVVGGCATPLPHGAAPVPTAPPAGSAPEKMPPPPPPPATPKPAANSGASVITIPTPVVPASGRPLSGTTNPY